MHAYHAASLRDAEEQAGDDELLRDSLDESHEDDRRKTACARVRGRLRARQIC
jgi:hypothetical protein